MSTNKKTPTKSISAGNSTPSPASIASPSKLKLEHELDRPLVNESPTKKAKKAEVVQVGVIGSLTYGDCAIEIKNGYSV